MKWLFWFSVLLLVTIWAFRHPPADRYHFVVDQDSGTVYVLDSATGKVMVSSPKDVHGVKRWDSETLWVRGRI